MVILATRIQRFIYQKTKGNSESLETALVSQSTSQQKSNTGNIKFSSDRTKREMVNIRDVKSPFHHLKKLMDEYYPIDFSKSIPESSHLWDIFQNDGDLQQLIKKTIDLILDVSSTYVRIKKSWSFSAMVYEDAYKITEKIIF